MAEKYRSSAVISFFSGEDNEHLTEAIFEGSDDELGMEDVEGADSEPDFEPLELSDAESELDFEPLELSDAGKNYIQRIITDDVYIID